MMILIKFYVFFCVSFVVHQSFIKSSGYVSSQDHPSRDEDHFQFHVKNPEIFVDTKHLPDGKEETYYLVKGKPSRFFFIVEKKAAMLSVIVTPCLSSVTWKLRRISTTSLNDRNDRERKKESDEILRQGHSSTKPTRNKLLKSYTGFQAAAFETRQPVAGVYSLVIVNRDRDGSVQLFASTSPIPDSPFPLLPSDPSVQVVSSAGHGDKVSIAWKRSPTDFRHLQPVEYCLAVNTVAHLSSFCAAKAIATGDPRPTEPPHAGFGFPWERRRGKERNSRQKSSMVAKRKVILSCLRNKTSFSFHRPTSSEKQFYYFDLFVVNLRTQSSSAYEGVKVRFGNRVEQRPIQLEDGKLKTFRMKASTRKTLFQFTSLPHSNQLVIGVRPCTGTIRLEISLGEILFENSTTSGSLIKLHLRNPDSGNYRIVVCHDGLGDVLFQLIASTSVDLFPYPDIPEDEDLKVMEVVEVGCQSIELAWIEKVPDLYYCLLVEPADIDLFIEDREMEDRCSAPRPIQPGAKLICRMSMPQMNEQHKISSKLENTLTGLELGTVYRITLYARKRNEKDLYLNYRPLITQTKRYC